MRPAVAWVTCGPRPMAAECLRHDGNAWSETPRRWSVRGGGSGRQRLCDRHRRWPISLGRDAVQPARRPAVHLRRSRWATALTYGCAMATMPCIATRVTTRLRRWTSEPACPVQPTWRPTPTARCGTATAATPMHFRLISESTNPRMRIPVKGGSVTGVQKVASTGFGAAHCLVTQNGQPQVYRYDSPYVFKTSTRYFAAADFASGSWQSVFHQVAMLSLGRRIDIVALDAHTAAKSRARNRGSGATPTYTVGSFSIRSTSWCMSASPPTLTTARTTMTTPPPANSLALDARTLAVRWSFETPNGIDAIPALNGTSLCFGDRSNTIYMFDTRDALAAAAKKQSPTPKWTWTVPTRQEPTPIAWPRRCSQTDRSTRRCGTSAPWPSAATKPAITLLRPMRR